MPVFQTLVEQGLISPHDYDHGPKQDPAPLTLVALGASSYETRWKYLQEYLTTDLRLAADTDGTCFRTLIVSFSTLLRWFHPHDTELPQRTAALRDVQHFLRQAEKLHAQEQGRPPLLVLHDSVNYKRPRVTIASRPLDRGYNVRGLVNEQEIVDWIEARYDVNVTLTEFSMPLLESMTLMEDTDVFFGMHGAGLTNTMFQKPGGVMIQMFPYGWEPKPGQFIRGDYYERMAVANECHYLTWINPHASNAHFYESDFPEPERKLWQKHPSDSMQMPTDWNPPLYWIYQSTYVDMESFGVAIDQAFKLLNYAPREQTLPQQHEK
ncbi:hypothetical protein WJX72_005682 [[Myrmecia] bisecta]|uniref:Glycosyltransferase 61 catalytic domain-containing protein n=1 Tax=[Myrmecia] bisecta TaxID=41462 RepID=A0AAW1Q115_9CHLO